MATTNRIPATPLTVGQTVSSAVLATTTQGQVSISAVVSAMSSPGQIRMSVWDATLGEVIKTVLWDANGTRLIDIQPVPTTLQIVMECNLGTATVVVNELTGTEAEGITIELDDLSTGFFTANAAGLLPFTAGWLQATVGGRAILADDFFTAAEFAAGAGGKFAPGIFTAATLLNALAANCLNNANLLTAVAAGAFDGPFCTQAFGLASIPANRIVASPFGMEHLIAVPVTTANIVITDSGYCSLNAVGAGEWFGLPIPTFIGQVILLIHEAGANACEVRSAQALDADGTTVLNFTAQLGQWVFLLAEDNGAALRWKVVSQGGGVANSIPVYAPVTIADPGAGANISFTASPGRCNINFAAGGEHRHLTAPLWEGQTCTISHTAGANTGILTVDNGFNRSGAVDIRFPATFVQNITFIAVTESGVGLRWRILADPYDLARTIVDPGAAAGIPITYDDGICQINIAAPADDRTLADATYAGQRLTIIHSAGANAGTVSAASDINPLVGGQNVINFTAAVAEMIVLQATSSLAWRVVCNPNALVLN